MKLPVKLLSSKMYVIKPDHITASNKSSINCLFPSHPLCGCINVLDEKKGNLWCINDLSMLWESCMALINYFSTDMSSRLSGTVNLTTVSTGQSLVLVVM